MRISVVARTLAVSDFNSTTISFRADSEVTQLRTETDSALEWIRTLTQLSFNKRLKVIFDRLRPSVTGHCFYSEMIQTESALKHLVEASSIPFLKIKNVTMENK